MENQVNRCQVRLVVYKITLLLVEPLLPVAVWGTKLHKHVSGKYV